MQIILILRLTPKPEVSCDLIVSMITSLMFLSSVYVQKCNRLMDIGFFDLGNFTEFIDFGRFSVKVFDVYYHVTYKKGLDFLPLFHFGFLLYLLLDPLFWLGLLRLY